ncbi:hypothetical protein ACWEKM_19435 [Streptomyces sp. NPDC004752]
MTGRSSEFMFGIPWVASFFHQDWSSEAATPALVIAGQFTEDLAPVHVALVRRDAQRLLGGLSSDQNTALWKGCAETGPYFFRPGRMSDGAQWMRQVLDVCDTWLSEQSGQAHLREGDLYDGLELADRVLAAIREHRPYLSSDVGDALEEAVGSCTPELAFRLLLCALPNASRSPRYFSITNEQYLSLVQLATAFDYGEYVLSGLETVTGG